MSAHIQDKPDRPVDIPDELESIFHVLIFFAVRFLHHNLVDGEVGQFLHDYFDDYSHNNVCNTTSGLVKRRAIREGSIDLTTYIFKGTQPILVEETAPPGCKSRPYKNTLQY